MHSWKCGRGTAQSGQAWTPYALRAIFRTAMAADELLLLDIGWLQGSTHQAATWWPACSRMVAGWGQVLCHVSVVLEGVCPLPVAKASGKVCPHP
jgi:hypothetical protein